MTRKSAPMLLAALFAAALPVFAQVYTWKDENGRTVVSDKPKPGTPKVERAGRSKPPVVLPADDDSAPVAKKPAVETPQAAAGVDPELEKRRKEQEAQAKAEALQKANALKAQKEADCNASRASLATLESGQRISIRDASGERVFMDDNMRAAEIARVRGLLAECNK